MSKIVLLILGLLLVYWMLKGYRRRIDRDEPRNPEGKAEDMVQCAECGVHLPLAESVTAEGRRYCSVSHQRKHQQGRRDG